MNKQAQKWLLDAFEKASLGAVYIDLQKIWYTKNRHPIYEKNRDLANHLRKLGVTNLWVVYTGVSQGYKKYPNKGFFKKIWLFGRDKMTIVEPSTEESIYTKYMESMYSTGHESEPITKDTRQYSTIIFSGISDPNCVTSSIVGALRHTEANIIVPLDATTLNKKKLLKSIFRETFYQDIADAWAKRIRTVKNSDSILDLLESNPQPAAQHHTHHQQQPQRPPHQPLPPSRG